MFQVQLNPTKYVIRGFTRRILDKIEMFPEYFCFYQYCTRDVSTVVVLIMRYLSI